jgi:hypothetical protein
MTVSPSLLSPSLSPLLSLSSNSPPSPVLDPTYRSDGGGSEPDSDLLLVLCRDHLFCCLQHRPGGHPGGLLRHQETKPGLLSGQKGIAVGLRAEGGRGEGRGK